MRSLRRPPAATRTSRLPGRPRWCLDYPDDRAARAAALFAERAGRATRCAGGRGSTRLLDHARQHPAATACSAAYVEPFDLSREARPVPVLLDRRRHPSPRGGAGGGSSSAYRASGFLVDTHGELPDYLPMVLEFAACADLDAGRELLQAYRPSLELLRIALTRSGVRMRVRSSPCARRCRVSPRRPAPPARRWSTPAARRSSRSGWTPTTRACSRCSPAWEER